MNTHDALRAQFAIARFLTKLYLSDFTAAELLVRPSETANHIAWQLGHAICSEYKFIEALAPGQAPPLPANFWDHHLKAESRSDDPQRFRSPEEYLAIWDGQRRVSLKVLETFSESALDAPAPEHMRSYAKTVGDSFVMQAAHETMHTGQYAVTRRKLGKQILI